MNLPAFLRSERSFHSDDEKEEAGCSNSELPPGDSTRGGVILVRHPEFLAFGEQRQQSIGMVEVPEGETGHLVNRIIWSRGTHVATQARHQCKPAFDVRSSASPIPLDPEVHRYLRMSLGPGDGNRRFAEAVIVHLSCGPTRVWEPMEAARRVVELMRPMYNTDPRAILLRHPELMASVFQNADLLDPTEPATSTLSKTVMKALEQLHEEKDE